GSSHVSLPLAPEPNRLPGHPARDPAFADLRARPDPSGTNSPRPSPSPIRLCNLGASYLGKIIPQ
ncbi:hypothetical protein FRC08_004673, partial [Ceratobasidium sp. 394]